MEAIPSIEAFRNLVNEVLNVDTSDVVLSDTPAVESTTKDTQMAEEETEMAGGETAEAEITEEAPASMTLADLAAEVGMSEDDLRSRLMELGLAEDDAAIEAMLVAISSDEGLKGQVIDVIMNAGQSEGGEPSGGIM